MQNANKDWLEGCEELQKQRHAVEGEVWEKCGAHLQCLLFWKRKLVLESSHLGQNKRMRNKGHEASVPNQKESGR